MDPKNTINGGTGLKDHPEGATDNNASNGVSAKEFAEECEELKFPELAFTDKWTLWEQYETKHSGDYRDTMKKVACFNDPISFWRVWNSVPHSNPQNFIQHWPEKDSAEASETKGMVAKHYVVKGELQKISTVSLFKTGIEPAWEDPVNAKGGEFNIINKCGIEEIKTAWEEIIHEVITDNFPNADQV
jgi:hypothetical protein